MKNEQMSPVLKAMMEVLNVEITERFDIMTKDEVPSLIAPDFFFTKKDLIDRYGEPISQELLYDLVIGKVQIYKKPWIPKHGEAVWVILDDGTVMIDSFSECSPHSVALYKCGWLFRTKESAEKNRDRVSKEMKEIIKNESN